MQPIKGFIEITAFISHGDRMKMTDNEGRIPEANTIKQRRIIAVDTIKQIAESVHSKYLLLQIVIGTKIYEITLDESLESFHKKLVIATGSPVLPGY